MTKGNKFISGIAALTVVTLASAGVLCGCGLFSRSSKNGGKSDTYDRSYKKKIDSTEIAEFTFEKEGYYSLSCTVIEGDSVKVKASGTMDPTASQPVFDVEYEHNSLLPEILQGIIEKNELVKDNGHIVHVNGLPPCGGEKLSVTYRSGEKIYRSNNQGAILKEEVSAMIFEAFEDDALSADQRFYEETGEFIAEYRTDRSGSNGGDGYTKIRLYRESDGSYLIRVFSKYGDEKEECSEYPVDEKVYEDLVNAVETSKIESFEGKTGLPMDGGGYSFTYENQGKRVVVTSDNLTDEDQELFFSAVDVLRDALK